MHKNANFFSSFSTFNLFICVFLLIISFQSPQLTCNANEMTSKNQETPAASALFAEKTKVFAMNMMNALRESKPNDNIVFSPLSIQTCAAMARAGATGETAVELSNGLGLISNDVNIMADSFSHFLSKYLDSNILKIANKLYVMQGLKIKTKFNEILSKKFYTTAEELNFEQNTKAANTMNRWIESKTNNLIKDLISPSLVNYHTRLVLLNAIHFKGKWLHEFSKSSTHEQDFYLNDVDTVKVQMMSQKNKFGYAELPQLEAKALELRYADTDLTMLILLPDSRTGLPSLLDKMKTQSLTDMGNLRKVQVIVKIPKFKAEFQVELNEAFQKLGMKRMFTDSADFNEMLESSDEIKVSKVIHKAYIDVNEEGTEAAAATGLRIMQVSMIRRKMFNANHPFAFFIKSGNDLPIFFGVFTAP